MFTFFVVLNYKQKIGLTDIKAVKLSCVCLK